MTPARGALVVACLGLSVLSGGCASTSTAAPAPIRATTAAPAARLETAAPSVAVRGPGGQTATGQRDIARQPRRDPATLIHLGRSDISSILGRPTFVRRDATAEVWQYRVGSCVLDLFLYADPTEYRVTYFEFRSTTADDVSSEACLESLLRSRPAARESLAPVGATVLSS